MKLKTVAYMIRCLTNMHVGKGDATYEVVDKCVQRDVTTGVPCIYSSSLKGALRHFFTSRKFAYIDHVFGSDMSRDGENENKKNEKEYSVGNFTFFQANLLAYPVQSLDNGTNYILKTNNGLKRPMEDLAKHLSVENYIQSESFNLEEDDQLYTHLEHLPVIARNKLEDGKSENLWYEEVVPAESRFVFFVSYDNEEIFKEFDEIIQKELIQIGANGSIGYGFCKITKV